jgi:hypothetical protein
MNGAHARRPTGRAPRPRLWPWFHLGLVTAAVGGAALAAGLVAGSLPLVPDALARLVDGAPRPALLAVCALLGVAAVAAGAALAWPRRQRADRPEHTEVDAVELPTRVGRGATVVRSPALTAAGAADLAAAAGVVGVRLELVGDGRAPVVRATVDIDRAADLRAVRSAVAAALGRLAATAGRPADAAEVVLRLTGERDGQAGGA